MGTRMELEKRNGGRYDHISLCEILKNKEKYIFKLFRRNSVGNSSLIQRHEAVFKNPIYFLLLLLLGIQGSAWWREHERNSKQFTVETGRAFRV